MGGGGAGIILFEWSFSLSPSGGEEGGGSSFWTGPSEEGWVTYLPGWGEGCGSSGSLSRGKGEGSQVRWLMVRGGSMGLGEKEHGSGCS